MTIRPKSPVLHVLLRIAILLSILITLAVMVRQSYFQLNENGFQLSRINGWYWLVAVLAYGGTMLCSGIFWFFVLKSFDQQPTFGRSLLAFFASQLGKYIPGKAMVVVIRTDMIRGENVRIVPAVASVFVETLTWIFVGSAMACLLIAVQFREQTTMMLAAVALMAVAGFFTWPPVFRTIAKKIVGRKSSSAAEFLNGLGFSVMVRGWLMMGVGWCLNGLSLWCVLAGIPGTDIVWSDFPVTLACVSLATVAGFVSLLPGGLGVREIVMLPMLGPRFGMGAALIAVILVRLAWLATELVGAGIIYIVGRKLSRSSKYLSR